MEKYRFFFSLFIILIPTPDFPHFYYMLGGNLGSLLYGDVSVMFPSYQIGLTLLNVTQYMYGLKYDESCSNTIFPPDDITSICNNIMKLLKTMENVLPVNPSKVTKTHIKRNQHRK